ncbi:helix-turn-helix domain-containing protein [Calycomorphotria hydatis]|uniref:Transcriptional repressor DicA n=1 Tax=Calycomorphotria hydatis TaxID=2528027 RepID=A0A517TDN5_9PLAN|nr:helix-turn-helix transcriptional regulator [Calycomorphotria hydatis]QDT66481.1 transcriptional repressor DicA [Calycomorphotria hydatis]
MAGTNSDQKSIANRLKSAREQAGLSQGQVAKLVGMHRPTISEIEAGRRSVKAQEVSTFSELYEVSEDWLLSGMEHLTTTIELAARELKGLTPDDLNTVLNTIRRLRTCREADNE